MKTEILSEKSAAGGSGAADGCQHESRAGLRRMRHRSRSSPSRAVLCPPSSRQRSPSASPDRHARLQAPTQTVSPCAVGSAYFSPRPPPAPLRLVVRGPPLPVAPPALNAQMSARDAARRRRVVKRLLRDLVAALPLPSAPIATSAVPPDVRDAAVQAITTSNTKSDVRQEREERHADYKSEGEEWVGGVRALRDSHVRLVLRQLRHIERLNRALDRAVRSDAACERAAQPDTAVCALRLSQVTAPR